MQIVSFLMLHLKLKIILYNNRFKSQTNVKFFMAASGKQKNKRRPRGRHDNDTISKDRLTTTECQDDKDETSSTTTESSTGDGDEKVSWNLCHFIYAKTKVQICQT